MKIAIIDYQNVKYNGATAEYRGLGGSEISNVRIAEALVDLGHEATVFCNTPVEIVYKGVQYRNKPSEEEFDVAIHSRGFSETFKAKLNFVLCHDFNPDYAKQFPGLIRQQKIDKIIVVSRFHKLEMMNFLPTLLEKDFLILRMGVKTDLFENVMHKTIRLCYSSAPFRGLEHLLTIFPKVRAAFPEAELHLFGGFDIYGYPMPMNELYEKFKGCAGVTVHGNLPQKQLAAELCKSTLFVYPCTFPEVGCIAVKEAITAGLPVVTTPTPAILEMVEAGKNGEVCEIEAFPDVIIGLLSDAARMKKYREYNRRFNFDWKQVALELENFVELQNRSGVSILVAQPVRKPKNTICENLIGLFIPQGARVDFVSVAGQPVGKAREQLFDMAAGDNPKGIVYDFVYFVDDDVLVPKNSLIALLRLQKKTGAAVIGQMYFKKHFPLEFAGVALVDGKEIPLYGDDPLEPIYDASLIPAGSMFVDMKQVRPIGKPFFDEKFEGAGEDTYFTMKCRKNGLRCIIETTAEAIHVDISTRKEYHRPNIDKTLYCELEQKIYGEGV